MRVRNSMAATDLDFSIITELCSCIDRSIEHGHRSAESHPLHLRSSSETCAFLRLPLLTRPSHRTCRDIYSSHQLQTMSDLVPIHHVPIRTNSSQCKKVFSSTPIMSLPTMAASFIRHVLLAEHEYCLRLTILPRLRYYYRCSPLSPLPYFRH